MKKQLDLHYVLDRMQATGFPVPAYVTAKEAAAAPVSYEATEFPLDNQGDVWLTSVKMACSDPLFDFENKPTLDSHQVVRQVWYEKIASAADRYGIKKDVLEAVQFIGDRIRKSATGVRTHDDLRKVANWLQQNKGALDLDIRSKLVDGLFEKAAELDYNPSMAEQAAWCSFADRPFESEELRKYAEDHLHKLASGSVYRSDQFAALDVDEVGECLPDLLKVASFGHRVIEPTLFGRAAEKLSERDAVLLDVLMQKHGAYAVHTSYGAPIEISDKILASL